MWFQNWTCAQRKFDLKSNGWFRKEIARHQGRLPLYNIPLISFNIFAKYKFLLRANVSLSLSKQRHATHGKVFFLGMDKLKWHNLNNWFFFIFVKEIKVSKNTVDREKKGPFRSKWNKLRHKYSVVCCHWCLYNYKQKWTRFGVTLSVVSFAALVWSRHATRFYPRSVTRSSNDCK